MNDKQFRAYLSLMMSCDPWPISDKDDQQTLEELANDEAQKRGYGRDWYVAYHEMSKEGSN